MSAVAPRTDTGAPIQVHRRDLPLSCPLPNAPLWSLHPRIYLPIEASGTACCPYCSARYLLRD